ncbi:MAG TPA: hypothetical protein VE591_09185, partial [Candidatus Acidoferrum sp.]|nr:hypothetical protein [Candidatus Acidoferrum sp.]
MAKRRALLVTAIVVVTLVAAAVAARDLVVAYVLRGAVSMLGYQLDAARVRVTASSLDLLAPAIRNRAGEPVFDAARVDVRFSLRDLLPGSRHRFGLTAVDLEKPVLTLIHHADGSYNVALPGASGPPARPDTTPIDVRLRVRDGVVALVDRFIVPNQERRESLTNLRVDAVLAPHDPAYYRIDADLQDGARRYPLAGRGRFDHARAFASQHWYAAALPIGPLIDFAMATHDANLVDGRLRDVDARIYGFMLPNGTTDTHLGARAELIDGKLFVAKLGAAVGDAHGPLRVYDDGLTTTGIDATLAGVPLRLVGGVYGLAQPRVRFLLTGSGSLARLRTLAPTIAHRPIDGTLAFALRADGALAQPVVTGVFRSPRMTYGPYALSRLSGDVAVAGKDVQILGLAARYGPIALRGRGTIILGDHIDSQIAAGLDAPAAAIPYAGSLVPGAAVRGVVVLRGSDDKLAAHGTIEASGAQARLDAPFALEGNGTGSVGPLALARRDGASLYARVAFDRPAGLVDAVVAAHRLSLRRPQSVRLPGFSGTALPPITGTLDAALVGESRGSSIAAASGSVRVRGAGIAGATLGDADARFAADHGLLAAQGRVHASLQQFAPMLRGIRARGAIDAPVRFVVDGHRTVVAQIAGARFRNASVQGIPLHGASATVALQGRAIDVRGARLEAAGGAVVAQGTLGNGGTLRLATDGIDVSQLRAAGLPLSSGHVVSIADVSGTLTAPRVDAGITLTGAHVRGAPLDALAAGHYAGGRLQLDEVRAAYAGAVGSANGVLDRQRVALTASLRGAEIATLARDFRLPLRYPQGAIDADVRLAGLVRDPALDGNARIAAGSINGLGFRDVVVPLHGDLRTLDVRGGRATFGSTTLGFDATASLRATRVALRAEHVDLADFNDYFDAADTLSGRGHLRATVALGADTIATSGDLALAGAQLRRLPIGNVDARWSSRGRTISGQAHVAGGHGNLTAGGSAIVPARAPLAHIARSTLDLHG